MALCASAGPTARNHDPQSPGAPCPAAAHPQWEAGQAGVAGSGLCEGSHAAGGTADSAGKPIVCVVGEVLGISHAQIGIQDDFFRLGGDSILSIQLVSRMRRQLNLELSVQDFFRHKTIERLHEQVLKPLLHHKTQSLGLQRKQGKLDDEMSLTKVQQKAGEYTKEDFAEVAHEGGLSGLPLVAGKQQLYDWFEMTEIQKAYLIGRLGSYEIGNISNHVYCEYYYKTPLNVEKLEDTLNTLISKFEVLRTVYSLEKLKQRFLKSEEVSAYRVRVNDYSQWML